VLHVEDSEMAKIIQDERLEVLNPEYQTKPRVYYKNLYRYMKCFIAGSVASVHDGIEDCVSGETVVLYHDGKKLQETRTDCFGDYKFDNLDPKSGLYKISIGSEKKAALKEINLENSCSLEKILI
jgi:hypothetical protein